MKYIIVGAILLAVCIVHYVFKHGQIGEDHTDEYPDDDFTGVE